MERNLIFCFSGTGNSLHAARRIAAELGGAEIVMMCDEFTPSGRYDRIGFVFPCYAGGVPRLVLDYIKRLDICADTADYVFALVTCGGNVRDTLPMLRDALARRGVTLDYGRSVHTVGNYIAMYDLKPGAEERLASAAEELAACVRELRERAVTEMGRVRLKVALFYKAGNRYFKLNAKKLAVSGECTSCGLCQRLCPTGCIAMRSGKPTFAWKKCVQCMACVQWCPVQAIDCGEITKDRTRYRNPDIHAQDILRDK